MTLRFKSFEKIVRLQVKEAICESRELQRQFDNAPRKKIPPPLASAFWIALFGFSAGTMIYSGRAAAELALLIPIACSFVAIIVVGRVWKQDTGAGEVIWILLPLTRTQIFECEIRTFARQQWILLTFSACLYAIPFVFGLFPGFLHYLAIALFQPLIVIVAATHFATLRLPRLTGALVLTAAVIPAFMTLPDAGREALSNSSDFLYAISPAGWVTRVVMAEDWRDRLFIFPAILLVALVPQSIRKLRHQFESSQVWENEPSAEAEEIDPDLQYFDAGSPPETHGPTETVDKILAGALVLETRGGDKWLERLIDRTFNTDQQATVEFLWPFGRDWTNSLAGSAKGLVVCLAISAAAILVSKSNLPGVEYFAGINREIGTLVGNSGFFWGAFLGCATLLVAAPPFGSAPGLGKAGVGISSPLHASFPHRYKDLYVALVRSNQIRLLFWIPMFLVYSAALAWMFKTGIQTAMAFSLRLAIIYLAVQPALIAAFLLSFTTFAQIRWLFVFAPPLLPLFIGPLILPFIDASFWTSLKFIVALAFVAKITERLFRLCYRSRGLDLMAKPKNNW